LESEVAEIEIGHSVGVFGCRQNVHSVE